MKGGGGEAKEKSVSEGEGPVRVEVPTFDDESLTTFFPASSAEPSAVVVSIDDFDELFINSQDM